MLMVTLLAYKVLVTGHIKGLCVYQSGGGIMLSGDRSGRQKVVLCSSVVGRASWASLVTPLFTGTPSENLGQYIILRIL